jgi:hypothetical protein
VNPPPAELTLFFGRFHPLLVHLPVAFILLLAALELLALVPRFRHAHDLRGLVAGLAAPVSLGSALCGWLLSQGGGYDANLLQWHKWTGFAVAAATLLLFLLHRLQHSLAYRVCLCGACALLLAASHYGGSLTHGSDYLTRYAPPPIRSLLGVKPKSPPPAQTGAGPAKADQPFFTTAVRPVLDKYCVSCHGPEKSKGELHLDSLEGLRKGGESGPVLTAGQAPQSPLIKRLRLPPAEEDHMPPDGKPQPSSEEIALLEWWINAGAPADKPARELNLPEKIRAMLPDGLGARPGGVVTNVAQSTAPKPQAEVLPLAGQLADELGISISTLAPEEPWLQANASLAATNFGDAELARLAPLTLNLRWLDLGGTGVTDAGLEQVARMKNLSRLHLERTGLTDAGLEHLAGLPELAYLNLYGTKVTDAGLACLKADPKLRQLYLWQTQVTPTGAQAFAAAVTDKEQIERWQAEIASLNLRIRSQIVRIETGTPAVVSSTNTTPINTNCPVTGKPVNIAKTVIYEGKLVAFCCDNCKASFEKDPKPHLAKLQLAAVASPRPDSPAAASTNSGGTK